MPLPLLVVMASPDVAAGRLAVCCKIVYNPLKLVVVVQFRVTVESAFSSNMQASLTGPFPMVECVCNRARDAVAESFQKRVHLYE